MICFHSVVSINSTSETRSQLSRKGSAAQIQRSKKTNIDFNQLEVILFCPVPSRAKPDGSSTAGCIASFKMQADVSFV